jgi:predicted dehydrogenase
MKRRSFINAAGIVIVGSVFSAPVIARSDNSIKKKIALVGTGGRGTSFWGKRIQDEYSDIVQFVGLCDNNHGRVQLAKKLIGVNCETFSDFDKMLHATKPDMVIVATVDATHHTFIIKALEFGCDVITEKPMTTDELKCQAILDAERKSGKKVIIGFNYRYAVLYSAYKELLVKKRVGKITSVDFHWYLNTYHGADYFRRWHGEMNKSGSLLVHKSTHHFDLLNWWLDSDPVEVFAYGSLDHYGKNNPFRGPYCRACNYKKECKYYYDITKNKEHMELYVNNEKYDGYIRDNCVWREEIDIYDKMSVQIKYANNVVVNYSLTTYSPFEGLTLAFNGTAGRIDSWEDIPWRATEQVNQAEKHTQQMKQEKNEESVLFNEIMVSDNFGKIEQLKIPIALTGHGGGDTRLHDKIFRHPGASDPYKYFAGSRDGAMSTLVGVAARKSIQEGRPVKIKELTDIKPHPTRGVN